MQGVGAAWLMVSQGAGPLLVALTQTASAFPFFLLALPAGALGDIFDRRKLILTTEIWMFSVAGGVPVLSGGGFYLPRGVFPFFAFFLLPGCLQTARSGLGPFASGSL